MTKHTLLIAFSIAVLTTSITAQGYIWTDQGKLNDGGVPANGVYDIRIPQLEAIDQPTGADSVFEDVQVINGVFTVNVTRGTMILKENRFRFIEIAVRPGNSTGAFSLLSPRQAVNIVPYAGRAGTAAEANDAVVASIVSGIVPIENGVTGSSTQSFVDLTSDQTIGSSEDETTGQFVFPLFFSNVR